MKKSSSWTSIIPESVINQDRNPFIDITHESPMRKSKSLDYIHVLNLNDNKKNKECGTNIWNESSLYTINKSSD